MTEDYVVFLKSMWIELNNPTFCNDDCNCQWDNYESTWVKKGDSFLWYLVVLNNLQEGIDYKYSI